MPRVDTRRTPQVRHALTALALAVFTLCGAARASWMWVPPEVQLDRAEYVVSGEMTKVDAAAGTGVLVVAQILKGPDRKVETIPVAFSRRAGAGGMIMMSSADVSYTEGTKGVWILSQKNADGRYRLDMHPGQHMAEHQLADAVYMLHRLERIPWSEPVNGVAIRTLAAPGMGGNTAQRHVYVAVKNVSDKPVKVPEHVAHVALQVQVTGPDGKARPILYPVPMIALGPGTGLKELAPGESFYANPAGLQVQGMEAYGPYKIVATYAFQKAGGGAWTGSVTAPAAVVHYGLSMRVNVTGQVFGQQDSIGVGLAFSNLTDKTYGIFDVDYAPGWHWEFLAIDGLQFYAAVLRDPVERETGEWVTLEGKGAAKVDIAFNPEAYTFRYVYAPGVPVAPAPLRELAALPPGRYVAVLRRTLGQPENRNGLRICWRGDVEEHTGVLEILTPAAAKARDKAASEPVVKDGLEVTVVPEKAVFGAGETPSFIIVLKNASTRPFRLHDWNFSANWGYRFKDAEGKQWTAMLAGMLSRTVPETATLHPGQSRRVRAAMGALYRFAAQGPPPAGDGPRPAPLGPPMAPMQVGQVKPIGPGGPSALPPGDYEVVVTVRFRPEPEAQDVACWVGSLEAAPARFTLEGEDAPAGDAEPAAAGEWIPLTVAAPQEGVARTVTGVLKAAPDREGMASTLMRPAPYTVGEWRIMTGQARPKALDALDGKKVQIKGIAVEMNLEGQHLKELWPTAVREVK